MYNALECFTITSRYHTSLHLRQQQVHTLFQNQDTFSLQQLCLFVISHFTADFIQAFVYYFQPPGQMASRSSSRTTVINEANESTLSEGSDSDTMTNSEVEGLLDPNVVWWDKDNDPEHPYNWPRWRTVSNCFLISAMTFLTALASCKAKLSTIYKYNACSFAR